MKPAHIPFIVLLPLLVATAPGLAQDDWSDDWDEPETTSFGEAPVGPEGDHDTQNDFLRLGVDSDYMKRERFRTIDQINTFIPPLYQPAFVGHGYILPPGAIRIGLGSSFLSVGSEDFFKGGQEDLVHAHHTVDRVRADLNLFYGLDKNFTLFVNLPFWINRSAGTVHPAGVMTMDLGVGGETQEIGDVTVMIKKKWKDQGNFPFNFATVAGIQFPTGSNDEKFDSPTTVRTPDGNLNVAFGGGSFTRFSDDGRLPLALQPGTGGFGFIVGIMGTRQLTRLPSALHAGLLYKMLDGADGADPGDELRFFASFVKPVYKEHLSIDLTINGMHKADDRYDGLFTHPVPGPDGSLKGFATTPRPAFQGGTVVFFSPSLIWSPQPQLRIVTSLSMRLNEPELGPWPGTIFRIGSSFTF